MSNGKALYEELAAGISSAAGQALREFVLSGEQNEAIQIIQEEGFSPEAALHLYDYCVKHWGGADIYLVEISKETAALEIAQHVEHAASVNEDEPAYLIRRGTQLIHTELYDYGSGFIRFYVPQCGPLPLAQVNQLWQVVRKPGH